MSVDIGERIRSLRTARGLSQEEVARRTGIGLKSYGDLERGRTRDPHYSTLRGVARALEVGVEELLQEPVPLDEAPREAGLRGRGAESPRQRLYERRVAGPARIATLERTFEHLTSLTERLRYQGKEYYEAGDRKGLWSVFMDCLLVARGAHSLLADIREEVEELGGTTKKEHRLMDRLEHRAQDLEDVGDQIKGMRKELLGAETDGELLNLMPFLRKQAG